MRHRAVRWRWPGAFRSTKALIASPRVAPGLLVIMLCWCCQAALAAPSASNSCIAESGATVCGLSSSLSRTAGDEIVLSLLVTQENGEKCADDCAAGAITASVGGTAATAIQHIGGGNYLLSWQAGALPTAGSHALAVAIGGTAIAGTPVTVTSVAGAADAEHTMIYDDPAGGGVVGTDITFSLQLRDRYDNTVATGTSAFTFSVELVDAAGTTNAAGTVTEAGSGVYSVSYTSTAAGAYTLAVRSSDMGLNKGYDVTLSPGAADLSKFDGSGATTGLAGGLVQYVVQGRDTYGNALNTDSSASFVASVAQQSNGGDVSVSPNVAVAYTEEGRYGISFTLTAAGSYSVSISSGGVAMVGSPFQRAVTPAVRSAAECKVTGNVVENGGGAGSLSAGSTAQVTVASVDAYGNEYTTGDTSFSITLSGPVTCTRNPGDSGDGGGPCSIVFTPSSAANGPGDGTTMVSFVLTQGGDYSMALTIAETHTTGGSTVGASPYAITVTADQTAAGLGSVQISPTEHTKAAGAASAGSMIAFDRFGNQRNTNQAFVSSFQLFLTSTQDSNAMVGAPLSLAVTDSNSYSVSLLGTLAGNYALAVRFNGSSTMLDIPLTAPVGMTVTYGEISARGSQVTSDVGSKAPDWVGGDTNGYVDQVNRGYFSSSPAVNKFAVIARDQWGNEISVGGSATEISASLTSENGAHAASTSITDLENGFYGVSYQTTRAGWYSVQVAVSNTVVLDGAFRVFVTAGVADGTQSFACYHAGDGCYNRSRGSPTGSCGRWLESVSNSDMLRCTEADDRSPALLNVRLVDRHGNEVSQPRWQDFIRYSITSSPLPAGEIAKTFADEGCVLGQIECSSSSALRDAIDIESSGANFASLKTAGAQEYLYAISLASTVSGMYAVNVQYGNQNEEKTSKNIVGDISNPNVAFQCLPSAPFAGTSMATGTGLLSSIAGETGEFDLMTKDRFHNERVGVVEASETDQFFVELVGPHPSQQTQVTPGAATPTVSGTVFTKPGGVFGARYSATVAGDYSMTVKIAGQHAIGSPFSVTIYPTVAVAQASRVISGDTVDGRVDNETQVTVQAYDRFGNRLGTANDAFLGDFSEADRPTLLSDPQTKSIGQGKYNISFIVTKTGTYQAFITLDSQPVMGSPVDLNIVSGYTSALRSLVNATDISLTTAGKPFAFKIHAFDRFSNPRHEGGDEIKAQLLSPMFANCSLCASCTSGSPAVSLSNPHCETVGGPTYSGVCDSCPSYDTNVADLAKQCNGFASSLVSDLGSARCYPGTYLSLSALTKSGQYAVKVSLEGVNVPPANLYLTVYPNLAVGTNSKVIPAVVGQDVLPISMSTAGLKHSFMIKSHDMFMNPVQDLALGSGFRVSPSLLGWSNPIATLDRDRNVTVGQWDAVSSGNGVLSVEFVLTISGVYRCQINVLRDGEFTDEEILGSQFLLRTKPNIIDASKSIAFGNGLSIATSGVASTFSINSRDRYSNFKTGGSGGLWVATLSLTAAAPGDMSSLAVEDVTGSGMDKGDGSFEILYTVTRAGEYSLSVQSSTSEDLYLPGTPASVRIYPGRADASAIHLEGDGVSRATVDAVATFTIHSFDVFGNKRTQGGALFTVEAHGGWTQAADGSTHAPTHKVADVQDLKNGSYAVSYYITHAGQYSLDISLDSVPSVGSPFALYVHSGATSIPNCQAITSIPIQLPAGENPLKVLAKDRYGNPRTSASDDASHFSVELQPAKTGQNMSYGVASDGVAIYDVLYKVTAAGRYSLHIVYTKDSQSEHIAGSPLPVIIVPSTPDGSAFVATFPSFVNCVPKSPGNFEAKCSQVPRVATAGEYSSFKVHSRDRFGNYRQAAGLSLAVDITGPENMKGNISDSGDGTYTVTMRTTISGEYEVAVRDVTNLTAGSYGVSISGSPFTFSTVPTILSAQLSTATGDALTSGAAGEDMTFLIQSKDIYGNNRVHGLYDSQRNVFQGEWFKSSLDMRHENSPDLNGISEALVVDSGSGTYAVTMQVTASGRFTLSIFQRDQTSFSSLRYGLSGSPFSPLIEPGPAYPPTTRLWGSSMASTLVGKDTEFYVQSFDRYGNQRTSGQDPLSSLLTLKSKTGKEEALVINATITNHGFANYTVSYRVTVSATYMLDVMVAGQHVGAARVVRSPLRLYAAAEALDPEMTDVSGSATAVCTINQPAQFVLTPRDRFGNFLGTGGSKVEMSICTKSMSSCVTRPGEAAIEMEFLNTASSEQLVVEKRTYGLVKMQTNPSPNVVSVDVLPRNDGAFGIFFTLRAEGNYSVSVLVNNKHIKGSPLKITAFKPDKTPNAPKCSVTFDPMVGWDADRREAGADFSGLVVTRNKYGVELPYADAQLVQAKVPEDVSHDLSVRSNLDGTFALRARFTKSGMYNIQVFAKSEEEDPFEQQVQGAPFAITVDPGMPSALTTQALISSEEQYEAGFELSFLVQTRDRFGNDQKPDSYARYSPARLMPKLVLNGAVVKTVWGNTIDQKDGRYAISFPQVTRSGKYVLMVSDSGFAVGRTPMVVQCQPAALSPQHSRLLIDDPKTTIIAGKEVLVKVSPRDRFGNARTLPDDATRDAIKVRVELLLGATMTSTGPADAGLIPWRARHSSDSGINGEIPGLINLAVGGTKVGRYRVHVEMQIGAAEPVSVMQSPLVHEVRPAEAVGEQSLIDTTVPTVSSAGEWIRIGLQPADAFGNKHPRPLDESFKVSIKGFSYLSTCEQVQGQVPGRDCVEVTARADGDTSSSVYTANFFLSQSGRYSVDVALFNKVSSQVETMPGGGAAQPFILEVEPGSISGSQFVLRGSGARTFSCGTRTSFQVQSCDAFSNPLSQGGAALSVNISLVPPGSNASAALLASGTELSPIDNNDGSYDIFYLVTVAGQYALKVALQGEVDGVTVDVDGLPAQTSDPKTSGVSLNAQGMPHAKAISVGTAGVEGTFTLNARDQFMNPRSVGGDAFTVEVVGPTLGETSVSDNGDGTYAASYKVQRKGRYQLRVRLNGIHVGVLWKAQGSNVINPSPFGFLDVYEVAPPLEAVSVQGIGLSTVVAGSAATFAVTARDGLSSLTCCTGEDATGWVVEARKLTDGREDQCDSCWTRGDITPARPQQDEPADASFRVDAGGQWRLSVYTRVDSLSMHVPGSPFVVDVMPADVSVSKTVVTGGGLVGALLRHQGKVQVTTYDAFGNARTHPSLIDSVQAFTTGSEKNLLRKEDTGVFTGKYLGYYCGCVGCVKQELPDEYPSCVNSPKENGCKHGCLDCRCYTDCTCSAGETELSVMVDSTHVPGSPFRVKVVDASRRSSRVTSAAKSSVVTDMASKWIAGESVSVLVQARDTEGLDRASGGDSITAQALRQVEPGIVDETELIIVDNEDGTYSVQYTPTVATAQVIKIKVNGELIGRSRQNKAIRGTADAIWLPAGSSETIDAAYVDFAIMIDSGTGAGQLARVVDYYGSPPQAFASFAIAPDSTSSYTLIPSVLVVLPAPVSASRSNVFCGYINQTVDFGSRMLPVPQMTKGAPLADGASCGVTPGMASDRSQFFVQLRDAFGNSLTTGDGQKLSVTVKSMLGGGLLVDSTVSDSFCSDTSRAVREECNGDMALYTCSGETSGMEYTDPTCASACAPDKCKISYTLERSWRMNDGHMLVSYASTAAGRYSVDVKLQAGTETQVVHTVAARDVSSGPVNVRGAEATGMALTGAEAGDVASFMIRVTDRFGNPACSSSGCPPVPLPLLEMRDAGSVFGTGSAEYYKDESIYVCKYNTSRAFAFTLDVTFFGSGVDQSPYSIIMTPSQASAQQMEVSLPSLFQAGVYNDVNIRLFDRFKNPLVTGGAEVKMRLDDVLSGASAFAAVTDWTNGSYVASVNASTLGRRWLTVILGIEPGYSTQIEFFAGKVHAPSTSLLQTFRTDLRAGAKVSLQLQMRDFLANPIFLCTSSAYNSALVTMTVARTDYNDVVSLPDTQLACDNGVLSGSLDLITAGQHVISVLVDGAHIAGSPFRTMVTAGAASALHTTASSNVVDLLDGNGAQDNAVTGDFSELTLYAFDTLGNKARYDPFAAKDEFVVFLAAMGQRCRPVCPSTCDVMTGAPFDPNGESGVPDLCVPAVVRNNYDATYTVRWRATVAEKYQLVAHLRGVFVEDSPFYATVVTGPVSASASPIYGVQDKMFAGSSVGLTIEARDAFNNRIREGGAPFMARLVSQADDGSTQSESLTVIDCSLGTCGNVTVGTGGYETTYFATKASRYAVHVDYRGSSVAASPFKTLVEPVDLEPAACTLGGSGAIGGIVNAETSLVIYMRDQYGNQLTTGVDTSFKVSVLNGDGSTVVTHIPEDQLDGTLVSRFALSAVGEYSLLVRTTFDDIHVVGSPRPVLGLDDSSLTMPTSSFADGAGVGPVVIAGEEASVTVFAADAFGILRSQGGDSCMGTLTYPSLTTGALMTEDMECVDNADGTYSLKYLKTQSNFYQLQITLNGDDILGSPFALQVVPAPSDPSKCSIQPNTANELGAIAGLVKSFNLQAVDKYMNFADYDDLAGPDRFLASMVPENIDLAGDDRVTLNATITNNQDGTYLASVLATVAGMYSVAVDVQPVTRNGVLLPLGPVTLVSGVKVAPASITTEQCSASGLGLSQALAGVETEIQLVARDAYRNMVLENFASFSMEIEDDSGSMPFPVSWSASKGFVAKYTVTKASIYKLTIKNAGTNIPGSPWILRVVPAEVVTAKCFVEGPKTKTMSAGQGKEFVLQTVDAFGNKITTGAKAFQWTVSGSVSSRGVAIDRFDGTYAVQIGASNFVGKYQLNVTRAGVHVKDSPFVINVVPGDLDAKASSVDVSALVGLRVGQTAQAIVQARDASENRILRGGEYFKATLYNSDNEAEMLTVRDRGDGTYAIDVKQLVGGQFQLAVTLDNVLVGARQQTLTVLAQDLSPADSLASGTGLSNSMAGADTHISLVPRDAYANVIYGGVMAEARMDLLDPEQTSLVNASQRTVLSTHVHRLTFAQGSGMAISMVTTASGLYRVSVLASRGSSSSPTMKVSESVMTVLPSETNAATSKLSLLHGETCTASLSCKFKLQPRDRFGNKCTEPGEIFEATLATQDTKEDLLLVSGDIEYDATNVNYAINFMPTRSGTYRTVVTRYKHHVSGSLAPLFVEPGAPVAASSSAEGFGLVGAVVNQDSSVTITLRDLAGNPIEQSDDLRDRLTVTTEPSNYITSQITKQTEARYLLTWRSGYVGSFSLHVRFDGAGIAGSPFQNIRVVDQSSDADKVSELYTTAEGQAIEVGAEAGMKTHFVIVPRSTGGQAVSDRTLRSNAKYVVRLGPSVASVGSSTSGYFTCPVAPSCPPDHQRLPQHSAWCCVDHTDTEVTGEVRVSFIWEYAGKLSASIYQEYYDNNIESHEIHSSPVVVQVSPSAVSAAGSTLARFGGGGPGTCETCGLTAAIAGVESNFFVHVNDRFGNRIPGLLPSVSPIVADVMDMQSNVSDTSTTIIDGGDGQQIVKINPRKSGLYRFSVTIGGVPVAGMPSLLTVRPDRVVASSCTPEGIPETAVAGKDVNLEIMARDLYGNTKEGGSIMAFRAVFSGTQSFSRPLLREGESGRYNSAFSMTVAGAYSLAVVLGSQNVRGSPYSMTVSAGAVDASKCFAAGSNIRAAVAGAASKFPVYVRDSYSNYVKDVSVLQRGFAARLTSWAEPDHSRPGLRVFHSPCKRMLKCPSVASFGVNASAVREVAVDASAVVESAADGSVVMNFVALMPGVYVLNVTYRGTPIAQVLGNPCTDACDSKECTACPTVAPAPAPTVQSARFENNGGQLQVTLGEDSDRAQQRGLFDCSLLLSSESMAKLAAPGAKPQCTFANARTLVVHLAFGASLRVNEELVFSGTGVSAEQAAAGPDLHIAAGGLRASAKCETSVVGASAGASMCFQSSDAVKGSVRVLRPPNPVKPTAVLKGASELGPCDALELDASASYGSGGRQLKFELGLKASTAKDDELRGAIADMMAASAAAPEPYARSKWSIDPKLMLMGVPATFAVRAINFLDESSVSELTVTKMPQAAPVMMIEGPASREVLSTATTRVRGDVVLSSCATETDTTVEFEWSLVQVVPDDLPAPLELDALTKSTRSLYIAPSQLVAGHNYTLQLTGRMKTNLTNAGSVRVTLVCTYASLVAKLEGSDRAVVWGDMLVLDARKSLDLDGPTPEGMPVRKIDYSWQCMTSAGDACLGPENPALLVNSAILELDTMVLTPGVYTFTVTLLKEPGPRTASTSVKIWITPTVGPRVAINAIGVRKVNPGERLLLQGTYDLNSGGLASSVTSPEGGLAFNPLGASADSSVTMAWTQIDGEDVMQYPAMISIEPKFASLAIREGVLQLGQDYRFRLTVTDASNSARAGFAEIAVRINTPPSSGQCSAAPLRGNTDTEFVLECKDWVDEADDLPLTYEFRYVLPASANPTDEIPLGTLDKNLFTTGLPAPPADTEQHRVEVVTYIVDQAGGRARSASGVTVQQGSARGASGAAARRLLQMQGLAKLDRCVGTQNVECIIQLTIAVAESGGAGGLSCTDKSAMITHLRGAAAKMRMNKVQVAGFSKAIQEASAATCSGRRTMASGELSGSLDLVSGLVDTSKSVGLEGLAAKGMGHSLSTALGSISAINGARRSIRRVVRSALGEAAYGSMLARESPFMRRNPEDAWEEIGEGVAAGGESGRRMGTRRSSGDVLLKTLASLSESQLGGAVEGEDSATISSPLIKMASKRSSADALNGAVVAPASGSSSPSFALPTGIMSQSRRAGTGSIDVQATGMGDSPFDADAELGGGVASLGLGGTVVKGLSDPVVLEMPGGRNGSAPTGVEAFFRPDGEPAESFDGKVDTCQYWSFSSNAWDGTGCIAVGSDSVSGKLKCHCYHLTDFGGVASDALPKMSMPDPTNPGAAFKNFSADDITVILVLAGLLLAYCALMYWGWQKDRQEARLAAAGLLKKDQTEGYRKAKEQEAADELEDAIRANNPQLVMRIMRGSVTKKLLAVRRQILHAFSTKHKLLGGFLATNSNYTRPRRFTVLFCMLIGNMFVNALWIGSGTQETFIQKALCGVVSAVIMFPVSFFFAWIFMTLAVSPDRQRVRDQLAAGKRVAEVQRTVDALGAGGAVKGKDGQVIAAPSSLAKSRPPKRRNWIPAPDIQRIRPGAATPTDNQQGPEYKRRWGGAGDGGGAEAGVQSPSRPASASSMALSPSLFRPNASSEPDSGRLSQMSGSGVSVSRISPMDPVDVGLNIPRRSLPIHKGPRRPAPVAVKPPQSDSGARSSSDEDDILSQSSFTPYGSRLSTNSKLSGGSRALGRGARHSPGAELVLPHDDMVEGSAETGTRGTQQMRGGGGDKRVVSANVSVAQKVAARMVKKTMTPKSKYDKPEVHIDHRFQYMAYLLSTIWILVCIYFCLLMGVAFTKDVADAWILGFLIAIIQDLVVMESIKICADSAVKTVIKPQLASLLAASVVGRVVTDSSANGG